MSLITVKVNLTEEDVAQLKDMAATQRKSVTEVLRQAIGTEAGIRRALSEGKVVCFHDPKTDTFQRLEFP